MKPKWKRLARWSRKRAHVDAFEAALRARAEEVHPGQPSHLLPGPWPITMKTHPVPGDHGFVWRSSVVPRKQTKRRPNRAHRRAGVSR